MKNILAFLGHVIVWNFVLIGIQFRHELSAKEWIINILCSIVTALALMWFDAKDRKKKEKEKKAEKEMTS